jgi:hypothetical protein
MSSGRFELHGRRGHVSLCDLRAGLVSVVERRARDDLAVWRYTGEAGEGGAGRSFI